MAYLSTISNEQTAELPSARFDGEIIVVDREEQIAAVCRDLAAQQVIGFDTETRPSFKAGVSNKVALLQLSTHRRCYLIRLCRMRLHKEILRILSNPNILKIGADVAGDIRALHALRNFTERGFVDLQHIAPEWGIEEKSLRKISAIVLQQRVSKAQRLSNWEATIMTPQQQMYAATDAWVCIKIYEALLRSARVAPAKDLSVNKTAEEKSKAKKPSTSTKSYEPKPSVPTESNEPRPSTPAGGNESKPRSRQRREGKPSFAAKRNHSSFKRRYHKPHRKSSDSNDNNEKQI